MKKVLFALLFLLAFIERVSFDLGPNIELVTIAMLLASSYLGGKQGFTLVLLIMLLTDMIIGNTNIFIFTWSGFLIPATTLPYLFSKQKRKGVKKVFQGTFFGAGANFFFYIWTNFGVWLLDSYGMYPKTPGGLLMSYINGLPFWKNQLMSTIVFSILGFSIVEFIYPWVANLNNRTQKNIART